MPALVRSGRGCAGWGSGTGPLEATPAPRPARGGCGVLSRWLAGRACRLAASLGVPGSFAASSACSGPWAEGPGRVSHWAVPQADPAFSPLAQALSFDDSNLQTPQRPWSFVDTERRSKGWHDDQSREPSSSDACGTRRWSTRRSKVLERTTDVNVLVTSELASIEVLRVIECKF